MPPVLLPDTNGAIMDYFLFSVQAFVTKKRLQVFRLVRGLLFTLLPLADAAEADTVHLIAFGVFHLPTNAATTTPSAASMPTVSVQLLRKCFAQLSSRTCRHGGGEHVVLAATAVCMCLQRRGSATFRHHRYYV